MFELFKKVISSQYIAETSQLIIFSRLPFGSHAHHKDKPRLKQGFKLLESVHGITHCPQNKIITSFKICQVIIMLKLSAYFVNNSYVLLYQNIKGCIDKC